MLVKNSIKVKRLQETIKKKMTGAATQIAGRLIDFKSPKKNFYKGSLKSQYKYNIPLILLSVGYSKILLEIQF